MHSRTPPRLVIVVSLLMMVMFTITGFLARSYRREKAMRAEQQYRAGLARMEAGDYSAAIDLYTEALALKRDEDQYLQALAQALVRAGRTREAETYLRQLARSDPSNGVANLELARIYAGRGGVEEAIQHYQRAIYGFWPRDALSRRVQIRFELVTLYEREERFKDMEAELLRLLEENPGDEKLKKRIGRLFLAARSYENAASVFTEITAGSARDAEAYAGLGDAEFERGNYFSARTAYAKALSLNPDDLQSRTQHDLATDIINLNPMIRGLGSYTQLRRSQSLVERALKSLDYCLPEDRDTLPEQFRVPIEKAESLLQDRRGQSRTMESVEGNIALAEELERLRQTQCGVAPVQDHALTLVLRQLAS